MKGSFNKVYKIGNLIIKIDYYDEYFSNIRSTVDTFEYKKYYKDLNDLGIKTAKLYLSIKLFNRNIQIEEFIKGISVQDFVSLKIDLKDKLKIIKELILIYKKTINTDVKLDMNLKNFIIRDNEIIYIDFTPATYKSHILKNYKNIDSYARTYLDTSLIMNNLISYYLRGNINLSKEELKSNLINIRQLIESVLNEKLDKNNSIRLNLIEDYIYSDESIEEYDKKYHTMKRM